MIDFDNQTTHNIHSKLFEPILDYISDQPLELLLDAFDHHLFRDQILKDVVIHE
jgi:hypothetical protein